MIDITADLGLRLDFPPEPVFARTSGALWVPRLGLLAVADLHLGKAARLARRGGALLPPYEIAETLSRLEAEIGALRPACVACLGDSFDDSAAAQGLDDAVRGRLDRLARERRWVWITGNHDPAPTGLRGDAAASMVAGGLALRHIPLSGDVAGEVAGHLHPKATLHLRGRRIARRCFVHDRTRIVLPAFGAYAGGLEAGDAAFDALFPGPARVVLLGRRLAVAPRPMKGN